MHRRLIKNLLLLLFGLFLLNSCMYLQQPSMMFFPYPNITQTPADWQLEYTDVVLQTEDDIQLHGWYIPYKGAQQTLLFFHGNAGNISHRRESVEIFHQLGLNVLIIDFRGYGKSQGTPDEPGLYADARAAWQYLTKERGIDDQSIILFGRSLGAAVAARLAAETRPAALILESTFSSARDVAKELFPILSRLVVLRYEFDTVSQMPLIKCPVLVLHSPQDDIIPFHLGKKVFQAATEPRFFVELRGDHNSGFLMSQPDYTRELGDFMSHL